MARYNEINVGHFNRYLQKFTGIKGGAVAPQLAGDIQPQIEIFSGVENRYLSGWQRFGGNASAPAGAALVAGVQIRNPGSSPQSANSSNVMAVIERVAYRMSVAGQVNFSIGNAGDLGVINTPQRGFDGRVLGPGAGVSPSALVVSSQNSPSVGTLTYIFAAMFAAVVNQDFDLILFPSQEIPLMPGDTLRVTSQIANQALTVNFQWRERFLEESERI